MIKVNIDISFFTEDLSVGRVFGDLQIAGIPNAGDMVSFLIPINDVDPCKVRSFEGNLCVNQVVFLPLPSKSNNTVTLMFEDLYFSSYEEAITVMKFLKEGFGLSFDDNVDDSNWG